MKLHIFLIDTRLLYLDLFIYLHESFSRLADQTLLLSLVRMPLNIESYGDKLKTFLNFRPHSNFQMLPLPSDVPVAIKSPVLPLDTTLTFGQGIAQAVAFVTF